VSVFPERPELKGASVRNKTTSSKAFVAAFIIMSAAVVTTMVTGAAGVAPDLPAVEPSQPPGISAQAGIGGEQSSFQMEPHLGEAILRAAAFAAALEEADRREQERVEAERVAAERAAARQRDAELAAQRQAANPAPSTLSGSVWDALAVCESGGNWAMNSGNGFYGGIQFMHSTWVNMGGRQWAEYPHQATRDQQIEVATRLQAQYGWGQWPACSAKLGLR
jgi:hypothetical protein